jgi:hypothetical protein
MCSIIDSTTTMYLLPSYRERWCTISEITESITITCCITASGSWNHQLLAAMKKRRKSPNLPQDEGAPPLFWVLSQNEGTHPFMRARPHYFGCSPKPTSTHPLSKSPSPPSYLPATSADPPSTPIPRSAGDHTPLHPFWPQILHCDLVASGRLSNNITGDHYES